MPPLPHTPSWRAQRQLYLQQSNDTQVQSQLTSHATIIHFHDKISQVTLSKTLLEPWGQFDSYLLQIHFYFHPSPLSFFPHVCNLSTLMYVGESVTTCANM